MEYEKIKQGDTIEFYTCCNADRKLLTGKVEYKEQLGLISIVDGVQYEINKLVDIKILKKNENTTLVIDKRFSVTKTILSDFKLFAIVDNELKKVVCHLVYDNGDEYCEEMASKMLAGLNG
jgi:hypothetical protein